MTGFFENWMQDEYCELYTLVHGQQLRIAPSVGGWIFEGPGVHWFSESREGLAGIADQVTRYLDRLATYKRKPENTIEEQLSDGFTLTAQSFTEGSFKVLISRNGQGLGYYSGAINGFAPSFILGQDTISGKEWLNDSVRGLGFGDKMRDAAERVTGLPAVPFGRYGVPGELVPSAERSWKRRAAMKPVLGYGTSRSVWERAEIFDRFSEMAQANFSKTANLDCALALAQETGFSLEIGLRRNFPVCGWVVTRKGIPLDRSGLLNPNLLREVANSEHAGYSGHPLEFRRLTLKKYDTLGDKGWRFRITKKEETYASRISAFLKSAHYKYIREAFLLPADPVLTEAVCEEQDLGVQEAPNVGFKPC